MNTGSVFALGEVLAARVLERATGGSPVGCVRGTRGLFLVGVGLSLVRAGLSLVGVGLSLVK